MNCDTRMEPRHGIRINRTCYQVQPVEPKALR